MEIVKYIELLILIILSLLVLFDSNVKRLLFYTLITIHLSVPIFLLRSAQDSGIFPLDIFIFIILIKIMFSKKQKYQNENDSVKSILIVFCCYFAFVVFPITFVLGRNDQLAAASLWIVRFFMYYLLYITGKNLAQSGIDYKAFVKINMLTVLPILIIAAIHYSGLLDMNFALAASNSFFDSPDRIHQGILGHTRASMGVLLMAVFMATMIAYGPNIPLVWKILAVIVSLTSLVECFYSFSRSCLFGILFGSIAVLFLSRKISYLLLMIPALVLAVAILQNVPALHKRFVLKEKSNVSAVNDYSAGRLAGWQAAWDGFNETPLNIPFGVGLRNFVSVTEHGKFRMFAGHNIFLQVLVELGVVGLMIFAIFQLQILRSIWKTLIEAGRLHNQEYRWGAIISFALFLSVIFSSFSQDNLYPNWGMHACNVYLYFILGMLINIIPHRQVQIDESSTILTTNQSY